MMLWVAMVQMTKVKNASSRRKKSLVGRREHRAQVTPTDLVKFLQGCRHAC